MTNAAIEWRGPFENDEVQRVHKRAFKIETPNPVDAWDRWLDRHSLGWVTARVDDGELIGFLNVVTDGGIHAWLQDVVVDPDQQSQGIGKAMVDLAAEKSGEAGCEWLHVDFDDDVASFYFNQCGFKPTQAGLRYLQ